MKYKCNRHKSNKISKKTNQPTHPNTQSQPHTSTKVHKIKDTRRNHKSNQYHHHHREGNQTATTTTTTAETTENQTHIETNKNYSKRHKFLLLSVYSVIIHKNVGSIFFLQLIYCNNKKDLKKKEQKQKRL